MGGARPRANWPAAHSEVTKVFCFFFSKKKYFLALLLLRVPHIIVQAAQ
jgi:hypothetical protein